MKTLTALLLYVLVMMSFAAAQTIQGTVIDTDGKPVAEAEVSVAYMEDYTDTSHRTQTAADGTFELDLSFPAPNGKQRNLAYSLAATKGDAIGKWSSNSFGNPETDNAVEITLKPAVRIRGEVIDENNRPVAGVRIGNTYAKHHEVMSDAQGQFDMLMEYHERLFRNRNIWLWAFKEGYALMSQPIQANENVILRLSETRKKVAFRVVDTEGNPMPDVYFRPAYFYKEGTQMQILPNTRLNADVFLKTDAEGRVVFDCIPDWADRPITFLCYSGERFRPSEEPQFDPNTGSDEEIQVEMLAPGKLGGTLLYEDGTPLADAMIRLRSCRVGGNIYLSFDDTTKTDSHGKHEFFVYSDLVYAFPEIVNSYQLECQIVGKDTDVRVVHPGETIDDFDFTAQKTYRVHGKIILPRDFEASGKINEYRTLSDTVIFNIGFREGANFSLLSSRYKAVDSKGNEFEYFGRSPRNYSIVVEYKSDEPTEYEIRLPQGQFTAGFLVKEQTFEVSGEEPEVHVDLTLKGAEPEPSLFQRLLQSFSSE